MDFVPCPQARPGANGFLIAWNAKTGRTKWKWNNAPVESSPLLSATAALRRHVEPRRLLARTPRPASRSGASGPTRRSTPRPRSGRARSTSPPTPARVFALDAKTGRAEVEGERRARVLLRHAHDRLRARVHRQHRRHDVRVRRQERQAAVGEAARHATSTARPASTSARSTWAPTTEASTRSTRRPATSSGRSTRRARCTRRRRSCDGLVYYAICSSCGSEAQRTVDSGRDATIAVRASNGKQVWRFSDGKYANPVVADTKRDLHHGSVARVRAEAAEAPTLTSAATTAPVMGHTR